MGQWDYVLRSAFQMLSPIATNCSSFPSVSWQTAKLTPIDELVWSRRLDTRIEQFSNDCRKLLRDCDCYAQ